MNMKQTLLSRGLAPLVAALCLCVGAAAQSPKESEAVRLRGALSAALGESFEVVRDRVARRSNWHGGGLYWLAHLRARTTGEFYVKYRYRYKDHVHPQDPLYTFVEHQTLVRVGPRGCPRRPQQNFVCVGDTVILPVVVNDYTEHTFSLASQPYTPSNETAEMPRRPMEDGELYRAEVPNPAAPYLTYLGSRAYYSPHRAPGYTLSFYATFEAARPGSFNLTVGASSMPVVIVEPGTPITVLSSKEDVHGYTERFSSNSGNNYLTTPVILQPGERLTLQYQSDSHRGLSAGGENREALEASVKEHPPVITLLPFGVDPAQDFNEWIVEFLPPSRRE
jgi:hypothetical protein